MTPRVIRRGRQGWPRGRSRRRGVRCGVLLVGASALFVPPAIRLVGSVKETANGRRIHRYHDKTTQTHICYVCPSLSSVGQGIVWGAMAADRNERTTKAYLSLAHSGSPGQRARRFTIQGAFSGYLRVLAALHSVCVGCQ
ncbi:hypothetical protein MTO96_005798 [Rhipicephalus appendiculatus]